MLYQSSPSHILPSQSSKARPSTFSHAALLRSNLPHLTILLYQHTTIPSSSHPYPHSPRPAKPPPPKSTLPHTTRPTSLPLVQHLTYPSSTHPTSTTLLHQGFSSHTTHPTMRRMYHSLATKPPSRTTGYQTSIPQYLDSTQKTLEVGGCSDCFQVPAVTPGRSNPGQCFPFFFHRPRWNRISFPIENQTDTTSSHRLLQFRGCILGGPSWRCLLASFPPSLPSFLPFLPSLLSQVFGDGQLQWFPLPLTVILAFNTCKFLVGSPLSCELPNRLMRKLGLLSLLCPLETMGRVGGMKGSVLEQASLVPANRNNAMSCIYYTSKKSYTHCNFRMFLDL